MLPTVQHSILCDKRRKRYSVYVQVYSANHIHFFVHRRNRTVGLAECLFPSPTVMEITDIFVCKGIRPPWFGREFFAELFNQPWRGINYRERGLGSALLEYVKQYARDHGVEEITGFIASQDTPHKILIEWYQKHGFEVELVSSRLDIFLDLTK